METKATTEQTVEQSAASADADGAEQTAAEQGTTSQKSDDRTPMFDRNHPAFLAVTKKLKALEDEKANAERKAAEERAKKTQDFEALTKMLETERAERARERTEFALRSSLVEAGASGLQVDGAIARYYATAEDQRPEISAYVDALKESGDITPAQTSQTPRQPSPPGGPVAGGKPKDLKQRYREGDTQAQREVFQKLISGEITELDLAE